MAEQINDKKVFSLFEVLHSVQKTLSVRYTSSFWVKAEMNKLNYYSHSGHCYPELVEKKEGKVIAQIRSQLWSRDFQRVNRHFIETLQEPLKDGIKILFQATISFHPVYGLSLQILDIDPTFTLGDLEKEKQESILKLKTEQLFDKNKKQSLALLPQRVAVISVETSKGYNDFKQKIDTNVWGYAFFYFLFPALLQGDQSAQSIIHQLDRIEKIKEHFDVVALIRGGGGDVGLSCYNDYNLSKKIASFPLPVLTGIGHSTNETVSEMVAYANLITPTDLANFLIQKFHNFSVPLQNAEKQIIENAQNLLITTEDNFYKLIKIWITYTKNHLSQSQLSLDNTSKILKKDVLFQIKENETYIQTLQNNLIKSTNTFGLKENRDLDIASITLDRLLSYTTSQSISNINELQNKLNSSTKYILDSCQNQLKYIANNLKNLSPESILKRGFSITYFQGKALTTKESLQNGDEITTQILAGKFKSIVQLNKKP